jgi:superfamily II DNA or RNA helicase
MKPLREYQIKAIDAVKKELDKGINKQLLVMATGTGKTFTAVKAIEQFNFQRVLWITHTEELVQQSALAFLSENFECSMRFVHARTTKAVIVHGAYLKAYLDPIIQTETALCLSRINL